MEIAIAVGVAVVMAALIAIVRHYLGPDRADDVRDAIEDHSIDDRAEEWLSDRLGKDDDKEGK